MARPRSRLHGLEQMLTTFAREVLRVAGTPREEGADTAASQAAGGEAHGAAHAERFHDARARVLAAFEASYFSALRDACMGNLSEMARRSGLDRSNMRRRIQGIGVPMPGRATTPDEIEKAARRVLLVRLAGPQGARAVDVARILGIQRRRAIALLDRLVTSGFVISGGQGVKRRYFLRDDMVPSAEITARNRAKSRVKPRASKRRGNSGGK